MAQESVSSKRLDDGVTVNEQLRAGLARYEAAEQRLRESEAQFELVMREATDGLWDWELKTGKVAFSPRYLEMLGYREGELAPGFETLRELLHPDDSARVVRNLERCVQEGAEFVPDEFRIRRKDGSWVWVLGRAIGLRDAGGKPFRVIGTHVDISARKRNELALAETEARYRQLVELSPDAIHIHQQGKLVFVNQACLTLFGATSPDQLLGRPLLDLISPAQRDVVRERMRIQYEEMRVIPGMEQTALRLDGTTVDVEIKSAPFIFDGKPAIQTVVRDITERKRADRERREAEDRYHRLVELSPEPIFIHADRKIVYVNAACLTLFGAREPAELIGRPVLDIVPPSLRDEVLARIHMQVVEGRTPPIVEQTYVRLDGSLVEVEVAASPFVFHGKPAVQVFARDITQRRQAQHRIDRLQNLNAALSQTNEAIVRIKDQETLFPEVCRIAVDYGQFSMAAIVLIDAQTERLSPVAFHAQPGEPEPGALIAAGLGSQKQNDPFYTAISEGRHYVSNDAQNDANAGAWAAQLAHAGFRAIATFPLQRSGWPIGALILLSREPRYFDQELTDLLLKIAVNVSFALDMFDAEAERQAALRMLAESHQRVQLALDGSGQGWWDWDLAHDRVAYDQTSAVILRHAVEDGVMPGQDWTDLIHPEERELVVQALDAHRQGDSDAYRAEYRVRSEGETWTWIEARGRLIGRTADGRPLRMAGTIQDISQRKRDEERLTYLAQYDSLTGLPNRALFRDRLSQAMARAKRHARMIALLFIDLDRFKQVNERLGHLEGDRLLKAAAERMHKTMRESDTLARLGGDEFTVVVEDVSERAQVVSIAEKVQHALAEVFIINDLEIYLSASIGVAIYPDDTRDMEELLRAADVAMYKAKQDRATYEFYSPEAGLPTPAALELEGPLRRALSRDEFVLYYQPVVELGTGSIVGVEALLRWSSAERGLISPADFIPLAEDTGLIVDIGQWVLGAACAQAKRWEQMGFPPLSIAVNISPRQFRQKDLASTIARVLHDTGFEPRRLELELTESLLMHNFDLALRTLRDIKGLGVRISLDDFGTGYSSLSYLKRFPIDTLKIDQSFVREITSDPDSAAIADAIIAMAHSLQLAVIAEGVETEGQLATLRVRGCDRMQGYLFSRPVPADELVQLVSDQRRLAMPAQDAGVEPTLLAVCADAEALDALTRSPRGDGYRVYTADGAKAAFELLAQKDVLVVLCEQRMPEMGGIEFMWRVHALYPNTVRVLLSVDGETSAVREALERGIVHSALALPWRDEDLRWATNAALERYRNRKRSRPPGPS